jgi:hypothetical protein
MLNTIYTIIDHYQLKFKPQISKQAVEYHHNLEQRRVEEERLKERIAGLESKLADYQDKYFCEGDLC